MPFCPQCRQEYRPGMTYCPDCKKDLVDELTDEISIDSLEPVVEIANYDFAERFVKYLLYLNVPAALTESENGNYIVASDPKLKKDVISELKLFTAKEEAEIDETDETDVPSDEDFSQEDEQEDLYSPAKSFKSAQDRYSDYVSSSRTLIFFGIVGDVYIVLNMLGIFHLFAAAFSQIVLMAFFTAMLVIGVMCMIKSFKLKADIPVEKEQREKILEWFKINYSNGIDDSDELTYLKKLEEVKKAAKEAFPDASLEFLDDILDEFLN